MSAFFDNVHGGIQTPTVQQHVVAFDYERMPGQPNTLVKQGSDDVPEPFSLHGRPVIKEISKQQIRTTYQNFAFSFATSVVTGLTFAYTTPMPGGYEDKNFWFLTGIMTTICFFAQQQYEAV